MAATDPQRYITQFDSATSMVYALSNCLRGEPFAGKGITTEFPRWAGDAINAVPGKAREEIYAWGGWLGSMPVNRIEEINGEAAAKWITEQFPTQSYPGAMVGSANGAAIHIAAALGMPWLPQTLLVTIRRLLDPDQLKEDIAWGRGIAQKLLEPNPNWQAHQMHDPVQDRLMVSRIAYFRMKYLRLGEAYRAFLGANLAPAASLITVECTLPWPVVEVGERHVFQTGGLAAISPEEYLKGSPRVTEFLRRQGVKTAQWDSPEPTTRMPEAEWGFLQSMLEDSASLAKERGWRLRRLIFTDPADVSAFAADLYRWWYRKRGYEDRRLIGECFALLEPYWALRTRAIPYWMPFYWDTCAEALARYVDATGPYDELYLMLLSNGVESIGLAPITQWRGVLDRARQRGAFLGVNEREFPRDLRSFFHYHDDLVRQITARYPAPEPLTLDEFEQFVAEAAGRYPVQWIAQ